MRLFGIKCLCTSINNNHFVLDEIEENDGVAGAAAMGDFGVSEANQELLEANCTDLEPDIEADVSSRNCSNVPWSASTQGEPSNFSVSIQYTLKKFAQGGLFME